MIAAFLPQRHADARRRALRTLAAFLFLTIAATEAFADPRLVRIIWDVGGNAVYYKAFKRTEAGYGQFAVPPNVGTAIMQNFLPLSGRDVLQKGDHVRLYIVNYNRVSHVWHESSSIEQIAAEPSLVGPLLNALLLAITGAQALPSQNLGALMRDSVIPRTLPANCEALNGVADALTALGNQTASVRTTADRVLAEAQRAGLNARTRKLAAVPTTPQMWNTFDTNKAWVLLGEPNVLGFNFATEFTTLGQLIDDLDMSVETANKLLLDLDQAIVKAKVPDGCNDVAEGLVQGRTNVVAFLREVAGPDSSVRGVVAKYETGTSLWNEFVRKLTTQTWADGAIELTLEEPIGADGVLRVDGVFASPAEKFDQRIQRSVVVGIRAHVPALVISGGLGYNRFDFKTLQLTSATDASDGTVKVKTRLDIVDDTSWDPLTPIWLQSIRVFRGKDVGVYGTFGTTPDRNIFKNAIVGGSIYVPGWRTVFTLGMITARGLETKDLEPVVTSFSDPNGFALEGVDVDTLPLPETRWVKSWVVSASFALATF